LLFPFSGPRIPASVRQHVLLVTIRQIFCFTSGAVAFSAINFIVMLSRMKQKQTVLTLPAIALRIPVPLVVWRAESGFCHEADTTAAAVIRYEQDELANALGITAAFIAELQNYSASSLLWVTFTRHDAARYGEPERIIIAGQVFVIAEDGEGGFLILFYDDPATEGDSMSKPADDIKTDAETQAEAAAHHEQERELAASKGEALPGDPAPAPAQAIDPEDEKKKGGADPGTIPLILDHSLNIRPDIARGPGGDYLVTTMKNSTVDKDTIDALAEMDKANAARAESAPQEPAQTPGERDASPEAIIDRQNTASAKEQEAELAASTGAAPQQADDKSGMSYEEKIEARAEESRQRHAAEAEAAPERAQEASFGRD
jgi:hypothetical protein